MLRGSHKDAPNFDQFSVLSKRPSFRILGDELKRSPKLLSKEAGCLRPIPAPPLRLSTNGLSRKGCRFYAKAHESVRFIQLSQQFVRVDEFTAICLGE